MQTGLKLSMKKISNKRLQLIVPKNIGRMYVKIVPNVNTITAFDT